MTRAIATLALVLCGCVTEEGIQQRWDEYLAEHDACDQPEDCAVVYPGCPLGCYATVSTEHAQDAEDYADSLIRQYEASGRSCDYDCIEALAPACDAGHCAIPGE